MVVAGIRSVTHMQSPWWHSCGPIAVTSQWARWRLKSPAPRLFTQPFIQTQIKESIKAPRPWPLWGNSPVTGEISAQMASKAENGSIWWRHHVISSLWLRWFVCFIFVFSSFYFLLYRKRDILIQFSALCGNRWKHTFCTIVCWSRAVTRRKRLSYNHAIIYKMEMKIYAM